MAKPMELTAGSSPYSDGSGYAVTITVEQGEGDSEPMLRVEMVNKIPIDEWPAMRGKIDKLVKAAQELS
jgi:hypothetical protein